MVVIGAQWILIFTRIIVVCWLTVSPISASDMYITCLCTTAECQSEGVKTCNTAHRCYVQFLDRGDGSNPLSRGCVDRKTSLLCESRPPLKSAGSGAESIWPILSCCDTDLCNQAHAPAAIARLPNRNRAPFNSLSSGDQDADKTDKLMLPNKPGSPLNRTRWSKSKQAQGREQLKVNSSPGQLHLSPSSQPAVRASPGIPPYIYLTVIGIGFVAMVGICVFACAILRRQHSRTASYAPGKTQVKTEIKGDKIQLNIPNNLGDCSRTGSAMSQLYEIPAVCQRDKDMIGLLYKPSFYILKKGGNPLNTGDSGKLSESQLTLQRVRVVPVDRVCCGNCDTVGENRGFVDCASRELLLNGRKV